jgi:hypothetical protein|tara:strand:- start:1912 stop:2154 length:243 start_codon:yes stop_codon:yes gene_type:complete
MIEATIYYYDNGDWNSKTSNFPFRTETTLKKHLTSLYGKSNMDNVFWDIIEPEEEEGLEEIEVPDSDVGSYLKRKMRRNR